MPYSFVIPVGLDSADGVTQLPAQPYGSGGKPMIIGTALPTTGVAIFGSNDGQFLQEAEGSPKIERAEQCTCEHTLELDKATGLTYFDNLPRGTIVSDTGANIWRVLSCDYTRSSDLHVFVSLRYGVAFLRLTAG